VVLTAALPAAEPVVAVDQDLLDAASIDPVDGTLAPLQTASASTSTVPATSVPATPSPVTTAPTTAPTTATAPTVAPTTTMPLRLDLPPAPPRPVRILVVGDSTSLYVAEGLAAWAVAHPTHARSDVLWGQGLTFLLEPEIITFDVPGVLEWSRRTVQEFMPTSVAELRPDVVVLMVTVNDSSNRRWSEAEGVLDPFDARYRERLRAAYTELTDSLLAAGVPEVAWVVPATPYHLWLEPEMNEPERYFVQHEVIREVVAAGDDRVSAVDYHGWLTATGRYRDNEWRPDGVHLTTESATQLVDEWLGPLLVNTALGG
jgi:lysophospholipase L1-like esterase